MNVFRTVLGLAEQPLSAPPSKSSSGTAAASTANPTNAVTTASNCSSSNRNRTIVSKGVSNSNANVSSMGFKESGGGKDHVSLNADSSTRMSSASMSSLSLPKVFHSSADSKPASSYPEPRLRNPSSVTEISTEIMLKVLILGGPKTGKSAILHRYAYNSFVEEPTKAASGNSATVSSDSSTTTSKYRLSSLPVTVVCDRIIVPVSPPDSWNIKSKVLLELWDVSSRELRNFLSSPRNNTNNGDNQNDWNENDPAKNVPGCHLRRLLHDVDGAVLVFDVSNVESLSHLDRWREALLRQHQMQTITQRQADTPTINLHPQSDGQLPQIFIPSTAIPLLILGNKNDIGRSVIASEALERYAKDSGVSHWRFVSARTGRGVREMMDVLVEAALRRRFLQSSMTMTTVPIPIMLKSNISLSTTSEGLFSQRNLQHFGLPPLRDCTQWNTPVPIEIVNSYGNCNVGQDRGWIDQLFVEIHDMTLRIDTRVDIGNDWIGHNVRFSCDESTTTGDSNPNCTCHCIGLRAVSILRYLILKEFCNVESKCDGKVDWNLIIPTVNADLSEAWNEIKTYLHPTSLSLCQSPDSYMDVLATLSLASDRPVWDVPCQGHPPLSEPSTIPSLTGVQTMLNDRVNRWCMIVAKVAQHVMLSSMCATPALPQHRAIETAKFHDLMDVIEESLSSDASFMVGKGISLMVASSSTDVLHRLWFGQSLTKKEPIVDRKGSHSPLHQEWKVPEASFIESRDIVGSYRGSSMKESGRIVDRFPSQSSSRMMEGMVIDIDFVRDTTSIDDGDTGLETGEAIVDRNTDVMDMRDSGDRHVMDDVNAVDDVRVDSTSHVVAFDLEESETSVHRYHSANDDSLSSMKPHIDMVINHALPDDNDPSPRRSISISFNLADSGLQDDIDGDDTFL